MLFRSLTSGLLGSLCAFPLVKRIGEHLTLMRWLVIFVIIYAAVAMLRSALAPVEELKGEEIEFRP